MPCKFCLVQLLLAAFVVSASWASPSAPAAPQNLRFAANSGNRAPSAVDDAYRAFQTTPLSVPAPGVLSNDTDADGDSLTAVRVSGPTNGTLDLKPDGSFTYTPNAGFTGDDSFTYQAHDGQSSSNPATVTIMVRSESAEPWFEDSFEGTPPTGWKSEWVATPWSEYITSDTTEEGGSPPGGRQYSYRQWFAEEESYKSVTVVDHTTDTFTVENHGYANDTPIELFELDGGGTLPTGIEKAGLGEASYSYPYYTMNVTQNTFQVRRYLTSPNPTDITDNGVLPIWVQLRRGLGSLLQYFGEGKPVPRTIGVDDDISISYWMKYHPDFDFTGANGNKQWMITCPSGSSAGRIYNVTVGSEVIISTNGTGGVYGRSANVGGPYYMPTGEWVKFDWYIKVSPESGEGGAEGDGIIMGWVNNELRYNYPNIPTISSETSEAYFRFDYWNQHSNSVIRGENQERYLDLFRIGAGAMVLSEQGLLP